VKQSNVLWQPRRNRWTLIDFGLVARIGTVAPAGFSLAYAAPEVVRAYRNGARGVLASAAIDAWSLGVLAVELFTNNAALDLMQGKETVRCTAQLHECACAERA
jgi:serine/threonine protein kinase